MTAQHETYSAPGRWTCFAKPPLLTTDVTVPTPVRAVAHRILAPTSIRSIERMTQGVSTYVYRIRTETEVFYLRVWPEAGESFAPEARVHDLLRSRGVKVPEVIYLEDCDKALERSVMVTTEIPGQHVDSDLAPHEIRAILLQAGHDLAVINSIEVDGFGWIRRHPRPIDRLQGGLPTHMELVFEHLESDLDLLHHTSLAPAADPLHQTPLDPASDFLRQTSLDPAALARFRAIIDVHLADMNTTQAFLAHGDFDVTNIFHHAGQYTGIIDFGEIRGTDYIYDLAHFNLHDGETLPTLALPHLLDGYQQIAPLPPNFNQALHLSTLLLSIRTLARTLNRPLPALHHRCLQVIQHEIAALHQ